MTHYVIYDKETDEFFCEDGDWLASHDGIEMPASVNVYPSFAEAERNLVSYLNAWVGPPPTRSDFSIKAVHASGWELV